MPGVKKEELGPHQYSVATWGPAWRLILFLYNMRIFKENISEAKEDVFSSHVPQVLTGWFSTIYHVYVWGVPYLQTDWDY